MVPFAGEGRGGRCLDDGVVGVAELRGIVREEESFG